MSTVKHVTEFAENPPAIGRIVPLNMQSETNRLNPDSLIRDMTTANDCDNECLVCTLTWA